MRRALATMPGKLRRAMRSLATPPQTSGSHSGSEHVTGALDLATSIGDRQSRWLRPYGGVLQSGDVEIAVDARHLRISRARQTVAQLPWELIRSLTFRSADGPGFLVALTLNKPPQRLLDATALSSAEWDLVADMIAEATTGRLILQPPR